MDHDIMRIRSLDPTDQRAAMAKVTGAAALLISKLFKIAERAAEREEAPQRRDRLSDKDAGDIYRLFQARREDEMAERIRRAAAASMSADVTAQALEYLARLFGRRSSIGIYMATRALAGAVPADTVEALSTRYVSELEKLL